MPVVENGPGSRDSDPVDTATGYETNQPGPDIVVYNPYGPITMFQRAFHTNQSLQNYASPGLSRGWMHNYDVWVQGPRGGWGALVMRNPNGSAAVLAPQIDGQGNPTGQFSVPAGSPFYVEGQAGAAPGEWNSISITWKDGTQWRFAPQNIGDPNFNTFVLKRIANNLGNSISFDWSSTRQLQSVRDDVTNALLMTLNYDGNGLLSSIFDCYNRKIWFNFVTPASGPTTPQLTNVSQIADINAASPPWRWTYEYSSNSVAPLLTALTVPHANGNGVATARIYYNANARVSYLLDANGNRTEYTYNAGSTLVQVKNPQGAVEWSFTQNFDNLNRATGRTDSAGRSFTTSYGSAQNTYKATQNTDASGRVSSSSYDNFGNILTTTSPRGVTTTFTYDYSQFRLGRLIKVQESNATTTKPPVTMTYYEPSGLIASVTTPHPSGTGTVTATTTYDNLGNVLTVTAPGVTTSSTRTTSFNYTQDGTFVQSPKLGQPLTVTDSLGKVSRMRYDERGNLTKTIDALGNTTDVTYNIADQPVESLLPATAQHGSGRTKSQVTYAYVGGPTTSTRLFDEGGLQVQQSSVTYGPEGETLSVSGDTEPATTTYDALYRTKTIKDGNNNVTSYEYDSVGRLSRVRYPGAGTSGGANTVTFTAYNNDDEVLQRVDGRGIVTNYEYNDVEGELTAIKYPSAAANNIEYSYDAFGLPTSVGNGTGSETFTYNNVDVLTAVTTTYKKADGTNLPAKTLNYSYNADGSRAGMMTPAGSFSYGYDGVGRMSSLTNPQNKTGSWTYLDNGWLRSQTLPTSAAKITYTRNEMGQLTHLRNTNAAGTWLSSFGDETDLSKKILYDGKGQLDRVLANLPSGLGNQTHYRYDNRGQLTFDRRYTSATSYADRAYGYDAAGNPTSWKGQTRTFNGLNQETTGGTTQFDYDGNGSSTKYRGRTHLYDVENRLTQVNAESGALLMKAGYRWDGKRAWKEDAQGNRSYTYYDGDQVLMRFSGSDQLGVVLTWGANGLLEYATFTTTPKHYGLLWDERGNLSQFLDSSGTVLTTYDTDAWGNIARSNTWNFGAYGGQFGYITDQETGYILCTHRYYDPAGGRWLTRDPISYDGGMNLYGYVTNNPVNYVDPLGHGQWGLREFFPGGSYPVVGTMPDRRFIHMQYFFEKGGSTGFANADGAGWMDNAVGQEYKSKYAKRSDFIFDDVRFDDHVMRKAVSNIGFNYRYHLLNIKGGIQCQRWAWMVRKEYFRLKGKVWRVKPRNKVVDVIAGIM